ncbi:MAG: cysteine synthase family protein [Flavobacteriales bacterium]|nr:cysteine synthase family protein [Flavobacteriales bacterium]
MKTLVTEWTAAERIAEMEHFVGNTPLFRIKSLFSKPGVELYAKVEWQQYGGSVKARPAYNIIRSAIHDGHLTEGKILLDATSGNTGIAYAIFCAVSGIPLTLCIPENASRERKSILKSLRANIVYTSQYETTDGSQRVAKEMAENEPHKYFYADQYSNRNNWLAHYNGTAQEIWEQTEGRVTNFVAALGTTGTFTGTGTRLKELNSKIQLTALQPETALHGLEGWKHLETAKVPAIYNDQLADEFRGIDTLEAYEVIRDAAKFEGLLLSPSSAANLVGAMRVAEKLESGVVVTVLPDNSDKYGEIVQHIFKN